MKAQAIACLAAALALAACQKEEDLPEPQTPQEMYERVRVLLQPNVQYGESDFAQAMQWLRKAAEAGLLQAQTDLGGIYLEGGKGGIKPNGKEAFYWFSKAAEQGSKEALYYLGLLLYRGMDMPKDEAKALDYWQQAAEAGIAEAQYRYGLALAMHESTIQQGISWLGKAVESSAPKLAAQAACALGNIYATGKQGISIDMPEAARWYSLAARGGDASAQLVYGIMLLQGDPVPRDTKQGMSYLRLSAGQDNLRAIALLVNMLRNGDNAEAHEQEAQAWADRLEALRKQKPAATHR